MLTVFRTTGERVPSQTFKLLNARPLWDREKLGVIKYFEQLKLLAQTNEDVLLLEDDIHLKNSFLTILQLAICLTNNKVVINMASPVNHCQILMSREFMWTRAVYYPAKVLRKIVDSIDKIDYTIDKHYDILERQILPKEFMAIPSIATVIDIACPSLMEVHYK